MRISDWSSDVCSSDLPLGSDTGPCPGRLLACDSRHACADGPGPGSQLGADAGKGPARGGQDRKSVVEGKSVSVRVDLGGSRSIQTKKGDSTTVPNREHRCECKVQTY